MQPLRVAGLLRKQRRRHIYLLPNRFHHAHRNDLGRKVHVGQLSLSRVIASHHPLYLHSPQNTYTIYQIRILHVLRPLNPCDTNVYDTFIMTFDDIDDIYCT